MCRAVTMQVLCWSWGEKGGKRAEMKQISLLDEGLMLEFSLSMWEWQELVPPKHWGARSSLFSKPDTVQRLVTHYVLFNFSDSMMPRNPSANDTNMLTCTNLPLFCGALTTWPHVNHTCPFARVVCQSVQIVAAQVNYFIYLFCLNKSLNPWQHIHVFLDAADRS